MIFFFTGLKFNLADKVIIGSGLKSANLGLIGCMRDITVNGVLIEPRYLSNVILELCAISIKVY